MTQSNVGTAEAIGVETLPHWDMSVVYPGLDSPEFEEGFRSAVAAIDSLQQFFDENGIGPSTPILPSALSDADVAKFEQVTALLNQTMDEVNELGAYISSFVSTNSRDTLAQAKMSQLQMQGVRLSKLGSRITAWLSSLPVETLVARSAVAADHEYALRKAHIEAEHLLTPPEEELLAELGPTGGSAWSKLYNNFSSQLDVTVALPKGEKTMPMSAVRNLAYHRERAVRQAGYEAEMVAWEAASVPLAASLNGIKGEVNALVQRRGWSSPLAVSLFQNNIDQASLDAMLTAARESFPDFRRYLRAKARVLKLEKLAWYDIFAPIGQSNHTWAYSEGMEFIVAQFGAYSDKMRGLAERAFTENWIDAEPRPGKRDGAFCMRLRGEESRILANFKSDFSAVRTLAHELGHAYHNLNLAPRTVTQKATPMTLAETASIFCETIVKNAALQQVNDDERLLILEASIQGACQVVVDITSRFLFEESVFAKRQARELSVAEFCDLMRDAQLQTYGDGLDADQLHPFMWAAKGHYYSTGRSYYNFPYMFGLLFALGLYAHYQDDPHTFRADYDELLSSTGMFPAAELAARFNINIQTPDFWRSSLDVIRADIAAFEEVAGVGD
jgi:oligoendopeptidase F